MSYAGQLTFHIIDISNRSKKFGEYVLTSNKIPRYKCHNSFKRHNDDLAFLTKGIVLYRNNSLYNKRLKSPEAEKDPTFVTKLSNSLAKIKKRFLNIVYPSGVTSNYYKYANWRLLERFSHSMSQSISNNPLAAKILLNQSTYSTNDGVINIAYKIDFIATNLMTQIFKEIVSRIVKTMWVGNIGIGFDMNPRAFCFWGSLICTITNTADFLSTLFNFKYISITRHITTLFRQIGMLTTSASIGPIYGSFKSQNNVSNIGEITAKMEAVTPLCDLLGSATGSVISYLIAPYQYYYRGIAFAIAALIANYSSYCAVQMVVFRSLNISRCFVVLEDFSTALLKRLDRYLIYHNLKRSLKSNIQGKTTNGIMMNKYDYDNEGGEIAEMIFKREFKKANEMLQRFTQSHMCNTLRASRFNESTTTNATTEEPQNLAQKRISTQLLTPGDIAKMEPFLFPGSDGALPYGVIKKHIRSTNVDYLTLVRYLMIFKNENFLVVISPHTGVEAVIYKNAKPRDAILAILTYNIADKLWSIFSDIVDDNTSELRELWNFCKSSARKLFRSDKHESKNVQFCDSLEAKQGLSTVSYAYTMAKACIDELLLSLESAKWEIDKFDVSTLRF